jgi:hypothetical protein
MRHYRSNLLAKIIGARPIFASAYLTENTCLILPVPLANCTSGQDVQTFAIYRRALVFLRHELVCNCERFLGPDLHQLELGLGLGGGQKT